MKRARVAASLIDEADEDYGGGARVRVRAG
jgi:hypothetical protein